ncbi:ATP-binding protein [Nocardia cyriacigeorgica]|uniref:ATP-binding protein n=1 Tax=Nocardia cyriacigeorgica TaxID=135487 RepID=UPI00189314A3|nr:AAA family ATPase [Nocardia cyriacigeorgica]MBF6157643.1 ATP-binding protein [Nocardia cyriacigeorgica]MBF6196614.1 ATP-binding protein [Nocardia cyriacigeorgica]
MVFYKLASGSVGLFTTDEPSIFDVGDVVIIGDGRVIKGDPSIWNEPMQVGVVRRLLDDRILVEEGGILRLIPAAKEFSVKIGATVAFGELGGVSEVISDTPIRARDIGVDEIDPAERYCPPVADLTFEDFGGYSEVVSRAKEIIETPLKHGSELRRINARPIRGVLFTGPPGTGKTHLARIIANQSGAKFFSVSGPEIVSKWVGDSEENLRKIFEAAFKAERSIIFFDEIDSLAEKRTDHSHEASRRLVGQLLTLMDGVGTSNPNTVVIAATNQRDHVDPALLRPGRFDWEINFGTPDLEDRFEILEVSSRRLEIDPDSDMPLEEVALKTEGWSAARLTSLWSEAALLAAGDERDSICEEDLIGALERLSSRALSEGKANQ